MAAPKGESKPKASRSRAKASPSGADSQPKKRRRSGAGKNEPKTDQQDAKPGTSGTSTPPPTFTLIVDNGGDTLKYGWIDAVEPHRLPNVTARLKHQWTVLAGDEVQDCTDPNQMHFVTRSTERGIVTNMGNQVQVWKRMLDLLGVVPPNLDHSEAAQAFGWKVTRPTAKKKQPQPEPQPTGGAVKIPAALVAVLLLVPPYCPRGVLEQMMYVWMEDFGVSHVGFATGTICATQPHPDYLTGCLVDLGWSATHIVPTFRGSTIVNQGQEGRARCPIRRIPLGGRHLVNLWKYYASYRQWNLMDQEGILRDVFEKLGYVSLDFKQELDRARQTPQGRRPFDRNFVLPDYQTTTRGHVELTEGLKREAEALKKKKLEEDKEEEEEEDDEDEEDEDFVDSKLEKDDEEDDDEEVEGGDEEMETIENDQVEESHGGNDNKEEAEKTDGNGKKRTQKRRRKRKKDDSDNDDEDDDTDSNDDDNKDMLRQRLLRQKQEEDRRRKDLEVEQQVLYVSVERFTVPEVLFHPTDAGLPAEMAGLAHTIMQSIKTCPTYLQPALYRSIQLTGGVAQLPNLLERLQGDLRALAPAQFEVKVVMAEKPIDQAWLGAREFASKNLYTQWSASREEWEAVQKRKVWMKFLVSNGGILV